MGRPKTGRSAQKTLRLTERAQFAVKLFAPVAGQSGNAYISATIEAAIASDSKKHGIDFKKIWHSDAAVRDLRLFLFTEESYPFDEEQRAAREFVMLHEQFFYDHAGNELVVSERRARELYPRIEEWRRARGDHWAPGHAMAKFLGERGLTPPAWPPESES